MIDDPFKIDEAITKWLKESYRAQKGQTYSIDLDVVRDIRIDARIGAGRRKELLTYICKFREACHKYGLSTDLIPISIFLEKELSEKSRRYGIQILVQDEASDSYRGVIWLDPAIFSWGACWSFLFVHELAHCWLTAFEYRDSYQRDVIPDLVALCVFKEMISHKKKDYECVLERCYLSGPYARKCLGEKLQKEALEDPCGGVEEFAKLMRNRRK